jgi:hypothetical protein
MYEFNLILIISVLFNDTVSNSNYRALKNWSVDKNEMERIGKEVVVTRRKAGYYARTCQKKTMETTRNLGHDIQSSDRDLKLGPPKTT